MDAFRFFNRDLSWLGFNERVLLEAKNPRVPLYERFRFLSIFSSNLDEFFRVRYPGLLALNRRSSASEAPSRNINLLKEIQDKVDQLQNEFGEILTGDLLPALRGYDLHLFYREDLPKEHEAYISDLFYSNVLTFLQPVILTGKNETALQNNALYFALQLTGPDGAQHYGLLNIPTGYLNRFVLIAGDGGLQNIVFLDDVIRDNIGKAFPGYEVNGCYSIKMTRSADISLVDEWGELEEQIRQMIRAREGGAPTRLLYEGGMPADMQQFIMQHLGLDEHELIEGSRYHNLKDLADLPDPRNELPRYRPQPPLEHPQLASFDSIVEAARAGDLLLHLPYQSYNYILRFFNEAAIDPSVMAITVTLYRVATDSYIANALISAAKNGKDVTVFVELKARFDEANNLNWAKRMKAAGVRIVYSIPGMKVHAKMALIKRKHGWKAEYLGLLSTGNFNESTARFYTDHLLLTTHPGITREMDLLFSYLLSRNQPEDYHFMRFDNLMVARFNMMDRLKSLIRREIAHKQAGKDARITLKLNNLQEKELIRTLYEASNAGVEIDLIIRGICTLMPGVAGMSERITVRRIVDRYLEHGRVYIFHNDGDPEVFMGSSDLMDRNLHRRIEVLFPLYSPELKKEMMDLVALQLQDNTQAVLPDPSGGMQQLVPGPDEPPVRVQEAVYQYIAERQSNN